MADTILIHCIFPHKAKGAKLAAIIADVEQNQRLQAGGGYHGWGVYAFFPDQVPATHTHYPAVEFEIEAEKVETITQFDADFAFIRVPFRDFYLPVKVRRFINLTP